MKSHRVSATFAGLAAILLWSGSISIQRMLTERLGPLMTGAATCLLGGALGCLVLLARPKLRRTLRDARPRQTLICGALFVTYVVCFVSAVGLATERKQALVVGVINYLWPAMTLVLSIPILKSRPRPLLPVGILLGVGGAVAAVAAQREVAMADFLAGLRANLWPYLLSLINAITWSIYSNLTRRWVREVPGGIVSVYLLASGVLMLVLTAAARGLVPALPRLLGGESNWTAAVLVPLFVQALGPALAAYLLWETAMRLGNVTAVAILAYLTPVFSLIVSCIVLRERAGWGLWAGTALVVLGAVLCKVSIREQTESGTP